MEFCQDVRAYWNMQWTRLTRMPHFVNWVKGKGPVSEGRIGSAKVVKEFFAIAGGSCSIAGGVACQPYSKLGDRLAGQDSRATSLPGMLMRVCQ